MLPQGAIPRFHTKAAASADESLNRARDRSKKISEWLESLDEMLDPVPTSA